MAETTITAPASVRKGGKSSKICAVEGCEKPPCKRGWCNAHYKRFARYGDPLGRPALKYGARCCVDGCADTSYKRGMCNRHYIRFRRHGDPLKGKTARGAPMLFYIEAVLPHDGDECLIWPFGRDAFGYGRLNRDGAPRLVHRDVCEEVNGAPPTAKHDAAHVCGMGHLGCVSPRHLTWKTRAENNADKHVHGTHQRGERSGRAKLTESKVRAIRSMIGSRPQKDIAELFGVSRQAIYSIKTARNWSWLD